MGVGSASFWKRLQVPTDKDSYYENTTWCNRDLIPIPRERRTWGIWGYCGYWTVSGCCISAWSVGSTLLAYGLSPAQAMACVVTGSVITGFLAVACGWMGSKHHIGFTVSCRFIWGMRGSYFPVILRIFVGSMWFGMQSYWGGQAVRVLIGAIIPGFAHLKNTFSESSHLQTNDFIGMVIWYIGFCLLVLIRPERLQIPFAISFFLFAASCFGILIWAVKNAGGAGHMFRETETSAINVGWGVMYGITAILGAWGSGTLGQSDWTRYANRRLAPTLAQTVAAPVTITLTALIGIIVTSAAQDVLGQIVWNPIYLLADIQEFYGSSPRARAGVFFASIGMVSTQLAISVVLNSMSIGMDMAGLAPKYINIRRGSYIMAIIGLCSQPWQLLATAAKFLSVLSGFAVFIAPLTGALLADYHVVRCRKLKLQDLYIGNSSSIYWYSHGFNWRGPVVFVLGMWPFLPGLIGSVDALTSSSIVGWVKLYNLTFLVGVAISFTVMSVLGLLFPPQGQGLDEPFIGMQGDGESSPPSPMVEDERQVAKMENDQV